MGAQGVPCSLLVSLPECAQPGCCSGLKGGNLLLKLEALLAELLGMLGSEL